MFLTPQGRPLAVCNVAQLDDEGWFMETNVKKIILKVYFYFLQIFKFGFNSPYFLYLFVLTVVYFQIWSEKSIFMRVLGF